jgi:hypothetical protein
MVSCYSTEKISKFMEIGIGETLKDDSRRFFLTYASNWERKEIWAHFTGFEEGGVTIDGEGRELNSIFLFLHNSPGMKYNSPLIDKQKRTFPDSFKRSYLASYRKVGEMIKLSLLC